MKELVIKHIEHALELKNAGKPEKAISELKAFTEKHGEDLALIGLIASIYFANLDEPESALFYAKGSVQLSPKSEMASLCLVFCLHHYDKQDEINPEIKRYINEGGKIDLYNILFEKNGLRLADFT